MVMTNVKLQDELSQMADNEYGLPDECYASVDCHNNDLRYPFGG